MHRPKPIEILFAALSGLAASVVLGEPPAERVIVTAIADDGATPRILVRWRIAEGAARYTYYDVLRREDDEDTFTSLSAEPIGPLRTAAAIRLKFEEEGLADARASIEESFGPDDYPAHLLRLQAPDAPPEARFQLRALPEQNYGAALALGLGWLDRTVVAGQTYVYEVWGLDALGSRVERLGRAVATAGVHVPLPAPSAVRCVDPGGVLGNLQVSLRWSPTDARQPSFGYDVHRAPRNADGSCPPLGPGLPGSVKVNKFPAMDGAAGKVSAGKKLFASYCAACHASRDVPEIAGKTVRDFRRLQHPEILPLPADAAHDTPVLDRLGPDDLRAIFDYVHEFQVRDDAGNTPGAPLTKDKDYCYQVAARDQLGKLGAAAAPSGDENGDGLADPWCGVKDKLPPQVPQLVKSERSAAGAGGVSWEHCAISWRRNSDDTGRYIVYRLQAPAAPRLLKDIDETCGDGCDIIATVAQPAPVERVSWSDTQGPADAAKPYYYAIRAEDSGTCLGGASPGAACGGDADCPGGGTCSPRNRSAFSGWVPCVPRDIQPPSQAVVQLECGVANQDCTVRELCRDKRNDPVWTNWDRAAWAGKGGDPSFLSGHRIDPAVPGDIDCPVEIRVINPDADAFEARAYRSLDGSTWRPATDHAKTDIYTDDLLPMFDTKIWTGARYADRSGNLGSLSSPQSFIVEGSVELPAPRISSVVPVGGPGSNLARIRFHSLPPRSLLGFTLAAFPVDGGGAIPADARPQVESLPRSNLFRSDLNGAWGPREGAETLDIALATPFANPDTGTLLTLVDAAERIYEIEIDLERERPVQLYLKAVGWSGREGEVRPHTWHGGSGLSAVDGVLEWPEHPRENPAPGMAEALLALSPDYDGDALPLPFISAEWTPYPSCVDTGPGQPFAVFRRRAGAQHWQQISPLFDCFSTHDGKLRFLDRDVEEGVAYAYATIRFSAVGEFAFQHGPATLCFDSVGGGCD